VAAEPVGAAAGGVRVRWIESLAVLGRRLTVGRLAEAIGLDYRRHQRARASTWVT
jgi:hypothetical protein